MNRKITTRREDRSENNITKQKITMRAARTAAAAFAALTLPLLMPLTAYAGDINSAEQSILSAISEQQEYQGAYYKVTDGYRAKVEEYLSRDDIDMSRREADDYIAQFHANIGVGISAGYMEKVGDAEGADAGTGDGTGADNGAGTGGGTGTGTGGSGGTGTGTDTGGAGLDGETTAGSGTENKNGAENGAAGTGADAAGSSAAGAAAILGTDPEGDGPIEDNTVGSTAEGAVEYVVLPMDEQTMYVQGIETLSVHEEAYKDSPVIGEVKEGEPVKVTGGASTGWAQIAYGEKTGYVSAAYLRTQGFMDRKEAEKKAEEEAKKAEEEKAAEEARKAEEAKKAEEEAQKAEEEAAAQAEAEAEQAKDYSDAKPVENSINLGMIALVIAAVCIAGLGGVLFWHKKKSRSGKR